MVSKIKTDIMLNRKMLSAPSADKRENKYKIDKLKEKKKKHHQTDQKKEPFSWNYYHHPF